MCVLAWLTQRQRKALQVAFDDLLFDELGPEDGPEPADVDERVADDHDQPRRMAPGRGRHRGQGPMARGERVPPEPRGPALPAGQQRWIAPLAEHPLRLYTVTQVRRGEGLTLADALNNEAPPLVLRRNAVPLFAQGLGCVSARRATRHVCRRATL